MENVSPKPWYKSKAVWGSLVAIVVSLAGAFGVAVPVGFEAEAVEAIMALVAAVGGAVALYGRVVAKAPVAPVSVKKAAPVASVALVGLLLAGCAVSPRFEAATEVAKEKGAALADDELEFAEYIICKKATAGAVERRYGQSADLAKARKTICEQDSVVDPFAPEDSQE